LARSGQGPAAAATLSWGRALVLVSAGGVVGALARYGLVQVLPGPWHTLAANLLGSLLIGVLVGARRDDLALRAFAGTGVLGGFTTMSTFAVETVRLDAAASPAYVVASVGGAIVCAAVGLRCGERLRATA
jgi:CrcB protein